ncbi:MAG: hypothetical protein WCY34_02375 [Candidatus Omnitrophota bacterium]|jgi:hypothetical protein
MKLKKAITKLKKLGQEDNSFTDAPGKELVSFMWELTAEVWSLQGADCVKRRLQRNITNLIKQ